MECLGVSGNELSGKILGELGNLSQLKEIYVGYFNSYEGVRALEIGKLMNLVCLDMSAYNFSCPLPPELGAR